MQCSLQRDAVLLPLYPYPTALPDKFRNLSLKSMHLVYFEPTEDTLSVHVVSKYNGGSGDKSGFHPHNPVVSLMLVRSS